MIFEVIVCIFIVLPSWTKSDSDNSNAESNRDEIIDEYDTAIIVFSSILLIFILISAILGFFALNAGQKILTFQFATNDTMKNFIKVITIEKPSTDELSLDTNVPIVKLKFQPSSCPTEEFELPDDNMWEFSRKNLRLECVIGEGAYGSVARAEAFGILEENVYTTVAVKMLKAQHCDKDMINLVIEMEIMKCVGKHENVLRLLGCCTQGGPLLVIMEYVSGGNLREFLRRQQFSHVDKINACVDPMNEDNLSEKTLVWFGFQIAKGMEYLVSRKFIHRDLAARNILVSEKLVMKIADFGLARDIHNNDYYRKILDTNGELPLKWMAPESLCIGIYTRESDVWSFGVLLWEIMSLGEAPYAEISNSDCLSTRLRNGYRMERPPYSSQEIYDVMRDCWNYQPMDRPTFAHLVVILNGLLMKATVHGLNIKRNSVSDESRQMETPPWSRKFPS